MSLKRSASEASKLSERGLSRFSGRLRRSGKASLKSEKSWKPERSPARKKTGWMPVAAHPPQTLASLSIFDTGATAAPQLEYLRGHRTPPAFSPKKRHRARCLKGHPSCGTAQISAKSWSFGQAPFPSRSAPSFLVVPRLIGLPWAIPAPRPGPNRTWRNMRHCLPR